MLLQQMAGKARAGVAMEDGVALWARHQARVWAVEAEEAGIGGATRDLNHRFPVAGAAVAGEATLEETGTVTIGVLRLLGGIHRREGRVGAGGLLLGPGALLGGEADMTDRSL